MYTAWPITTEQSEAPDGGMFTMPPFPTQPTGALKGQKFAVNKDSIVKDFLSYCHSATSEALDFDPFICELNSQGGMWGLDDLGATKMTAAEKKAAAAKKKADAAAEKQTKLAAAQEYVSLPKQSGISGSTMYLVVGGAALLVVGAIAVWGFSRK